MVSDSIKTFRIDWKGSKFLWGFTVAASMVMVMLLLSLFIFVRINRNIMSDNDTHQYYELSSMQSYIRDNLSRLESQVILLSKTPSLLRYLEGNKEEEESLKYLFSEVIEHSNISLQPTLDQVRLLDIEGMERIRVDLNDENKAFVTANEDLQFKGNRYYIENARTLPPGKIYISPLDLNVEQCKVEVPHKPMVRATCPIRNHQGIHIGFLVLNQAYQSVFDKLDTMNIHPGDQWYLLNEEGYYLKGPQKNKEFGFMWEELKNTGFFSDFPDLWRQFQQQKETRVLTDEGVFYCQNFDPIVGTSFNFSEYHQWYIVMHVSMENLRKERGLLTRALFIANLILIPLLAYLGWSLGVSRFRNRRYISTLQRMATHDDRTGLFNHQGAREQLDLLIQLCQRNKQPLSVAFLDVNGLKKVNDTLGHKMGDKLIVAMSQSIKEVIRRSDVAARIGGDEFLIVFPEMEITHVETIIERIQENFHDKGHDLLSSHCSFSWGISQWKEGKDSSESIISRADKKMYHMKKSIK